VIPQPNPPVEPSPWPPGHPVDLKAFVRALQPAHAFGRPTAAEYRRTAILAETPEPRRIEAQPIEPVGYLDGIQRRGLVARVEHRDVTVAYVSAGTVRDKTLLDVQERLAVLCSIQDESLVRSAMPDIPVVALLELLPWGVASATDDWLDGTRRHLEVLALDLAPSADGKFVVVDGRLRAECPREDAVGIVKNATDTQWLLDDSLLPAAGGWRSPALRLPAARAGERPILTSFVRLRDASGHHPWGFSLIRVESFEDAGIEVLDAAAALAVAQRQPLGSGDPRAEIHLTGFRRAEDVLRARAPFAIEVLP
jgi:hypothetical protein